MTEQVKKEIVRSAIEYMNGKGMSQNAMCSGSKINVGYLSYMLKGELSINGTIIADKWFNQLAEYIGFKVEKTYWEVKSTPQFLSMILSLQEAKQHPKALILIGSTGSGKTFSTDRFLNQHPVHTYRITAGDHYKTKDIVNEICELVGVQTNGVIYDKLRRLSARLNEIRLAGGNPVIVIDEAENLKIPVIKILKSVYDKVGHSCSIVLIGTPEMLTMIDRGVSKGRPGLPQFKRRFKAGIRLLPGIDTSFDQFLNDFALERGLINLLRVLCTNYGELHDYLEPVLREADVKNVKITEEFFRQYHHLPIGRAK
jgi:DNA transposition AAA+ family ATPase